MNVNISLDYSQWHPYMNETLEKNTSTTIQCSSVSYEMQRQVGVSRKRTFTRYRDCDVLEIERKTYRKTKKAYGKSIGQFKFNKPSKTQVINEDKRKYITHYRLGKPNSLAVKEVKYNKLLRRFQTSTNDESVNHQDKVSDSHSTISLTEMDHSLYDWSNPYNLMNNTFLTGNNSELDKIFPRKNTLAIHQT